MISPCKGGFACPLREAHLEPIFGKAGAEVVEVLGVFVVRDEESDGGARVSRVEVDYHRTCKQNQ